MVFLIHVHVRDSWIIFAFTLLSKRENHCIVTFYNVFFSGVGWHESHLLWFFFLNSIGFPICIIMSCFSNFNSNSHTQFKNYYKHGRFMDGRFTKLFERRNTTPIGIDAFFVVFLHSNNFSLLLKIYRRYQLK